MIEWMNEILNPKATSTSKLLKGTVNSLDSYVVLVSFAIPFAGKGGCGISSHTQFSLNSCDKSRDADFCHDANLEIQAHCNYKDQQMLKCIKWIDKVGYWSSLVQ